MPDELTQLCAREFARHIDDLFGKYRIETFSDGPDWVEAPVVGLFYRAGDEVAAAALACGQTNNFAKLPEQLVVARIDLLYDRFPI
jgi:hypothetical protein